MWHNVSGPQHHDSRIVCEASSEYTYSSLNIGGDKRTKELLDTGMIVCYTCGGPCLLYAIVVTNKARKGKKKVSSTRVLCHECFVVCRPEIDMLLEADVMTIRSNYEIYTRGAYLA